MKRLFFLTALILACSLTLSACGSSSAGPKSWLDRPLDQTHYPLEPIEIMAHASSDKGVANFSFSIDGEILHQVSVKGNRLERATYQWTPEEPGMYTVGAIATDSSGNTGGEATSVIYIGGAGQSVPSVYYGECEGVEHITLTANPFSIPPGECSLVYWEVIAPEEWPVFIDGEPVDHIGELPFCLQESTAVELSIETNDGICQKWELIDVDDDPFIDIEPSSELTVLFDGNPTEIHPGECSTLFWEVFPAEGGETILQGQLVPFTGEMEVCPEEPTFYELIAVRNGVGMASFVLIDFLDGESDFTPTPGLTSTSLPPGVPTPTTKPSSGPTNTPASPGPTNTPAADTTPPTINNASVSPNDFIYNTNGSCSPTTFKFSVKVTDPGGVASVKLNWTGSGVRSGSENMNYSGGKYVKNLGLFVNTGSLSNFSITARDNAGNTSTISPSWNLDIEECGGGS